MQFVFVTARGMLRSARSDPSYEQHAHCQSCANLEPAEFFVLTHQPKKPSEAVERHSMPETMLAECGHVSVKVTGRGFLA
jgi:hypothetical protein